MGHKLMTQQTTTSKTQEADKEIIMLKSHKVTIQEVDGILSVSIIPFNENCMDCSVIQHDVHESVIRISTMREVRTDAQRISKMMVV